MRSARITENKVQCFYEQEAAIYFNTRFKSRHGLFVDSLQKSKVLKLIGDCKGKRVLEIGSGTGRFTKELVKQGADVVCVDLSRQMHEFSRLSLKRSIVEHLSNEWFASSI